MAFITSDVCAEVVLCPPNEIIQECLPMGDELECEYTIDLEVPWEKWAFYNHDHYATGYYGYYNQYEVEYRQDVQFLLDKMVRADGSEYWHARTDSETTDGNDFISGKGLLDYIKKYNSEAVAQFDPSVYLGDLIHFELYGGDGNDRVEGANNADSLFGGKGYDKIIGWAGDDYIDGGKDNDEIYAGDGNDIVFGGAGRGHDTIHGGKGDDELDGGAGNDHIYGDDGNDNLTGGKGYDSLNGGYGNDWMSGGKHDDYMSGDGGDDCMDGGSGNDTMHGGYGNDIMLGRGGNDTMNGDYGDDQMEGGDGYDYMDGGDGNDLVSGGAGNDTVKGGYGDDIVRGGLGDDVMWGGEGCDQFVFCEIDYDCYDWIKDFNVRDRDQIDLAELDISAVKVVLTGHKDSVFLDLMAGDEEAGRIRVDSGDYADLSSVFSTDTAFGTGQGAVVQIAQGVLVDLPSTSVLYTDGGMFF